MSSSKRRAAQRRALRWAQNDLCAGCAGFLPSAKRLTLHHPDYPTFDHMVTRSSGGGRTLSNGLLKHQRCNQRRANRAATGCDLIWQTLVQARLSNRPDSLKSTFVGGSPNPDTRPERRPDLPQGPRKHARHRAGFFISEG